MRHLIEVLGRKRRISQNGYRVETAVSWIETHLNDMKRVTEDSIETAKAVGADDVVKDLEKFRGELKKLGKKLAGIDMVVIDFVKADR